MDMNVNWKDFSPVPLDMIKAWLKGEYLIGQNESIGYELLGWALVLRGLYVYAVVPANENTTNSEVDKNTKGQFEEKENIWKQASHCGICKIDIKDGDITYHGVRLGVMDKKSANEKLMLDEERDNFQVWYSIFSKLTNLPSHPAPDAYFAYVMYSVPPNQADKFGLTKEKAIELKLIKNVGETLSVFERSLRKSADQNGEQEDNWDFDKNEMCKYLISIESHLDHQEFKKSDEVTAIVHIQMGEWKSGERKGHLQPVLTKRGGKPQNLSGPGTIYFYPLADQTR